MDEKNNGARRRKAFADFKEDQYDNSFVLNPKQKRNKIIKKTVTIALIIIITALFIIIGFCFTDSLLNISEEPYKDTNTYTAKYVNTTTTTTKATEASTDEEQSSVSQENSDFSESTTSQSSTAQAPYQY